MMTALLSIVMFIIIFVCVYYLYVKIRTGWSDESAERYHNRINQADHSERHISLHRVPAYTGPVIERTENETGPMVYFANDRHGRNDKMYKFNYKKVGYAWKAYILRMPDLNGRSGDCSITHRLHDDGGYYVCWDRPVSTLKEMQTISRVWADSIQEYIATGRGFG